MTVIKKYFTENEPFRMDRDHFAYTKASIKT